MSLFDRLFDRIRLIIFKIEWQKRNKDNETTADNAFPIDLVTVGKRTYGPIRVMSFDYNSKCSIGCFCSIANDVTFLLSADHSLDTISTFPFRVKVCGERKEGISKGDIIVDDDVWIGQAAIILSNVHIGQGAVVAAGAVVTNDVPPYSVVGGVPAKVIKYRFENSLIEQLLKIDYSSLSDELIKDHIDELIETLRSVEQLLWLPHI